MYKVLQQEVPTKDAKASEVLWVESHKGQEVLAVQSCLPLSFLPCHVLSGLQILFH